jgi:hypothetical protein
MPNLTQPIPGEDLATIAGRALGDPSRFREIAELNGGLNPLDPIGTAGVLIPTQEELASVVEPALQSVRTGVTSVLQQATADIQGYIPEVLRDVADINGIVGLVEGPLNQVLDTVADRVYGGRTQLIDWLLDAQGQTNTITSRTQGIGQQLLNAIDL